MTELLCLEDSYLKENEAKIEKINKNSIILDKTIFYPQGGGQPYDTGKIIFNQKEYKIISVKKIEGEIIHELENVEELNINDKIKCVIDWERRYKLMRMHTSAHLLSAMFNNENKVLITGNQLDFEISRIDFSLEELDREKINEYFKLANEYIQKDLKVKVYSLPKEEALKIPSVIKLAGALPPNIPILRIVEIENVDVQADGGTHVKSLKEIGMIILDRIENKGSKNRRVYFKLS